MNLENQSTVLEDIGVQALVSGGYVSAVDMIADVDAITGQDVLKVSCFSYKPAKTQGVGGRSRPKYSDMFHDQSWGC